MRSPNMPHEAVEQAIAEQIYLKNVHVLHGKYAKKFGGDFDFDLVYILDGDRYPKRGGMAPWNAGKSPAGERQAEEDFLLA